MAERIIFHVDVNSAFLSWTAAYRCKVLGEELDLRQVPSVIAGQKDSRRSIVLAKSGPAKKFGIQTGEPLGMAKDKCPGLIVAEPDYDLYISASRRLMQLLRDVSPVVEQFSVDEAWVDMTGTQRLYGTPLLAAQWLKDKIHRELGFTVNIGVSSNKLLAKIAGDMEKPDKVISLFPWELEEKLWHLPVRELFYVGAATEGKLRQMGIQTIGQLAKADPAGLKRKLHSHGEMIWHLANGRCTKFLTAEPPEQKGYGNAMTTPVDVVNMPYAQQILLCLCETVASRMRRDGQTGACVGVHIRTSDFRDYGCQRQLSSPTNVTTEIYHGACSLLEELWDKQTPLRQLGVRMMKVSKENCRQYSLFDEKDYGRMEQLDAAVDGIREKFGDKAICHASVLKFQNPREGAQEVAFGASGREEKREQQEIQKRLEGLKDV